MVLPSALPAGVSPAPPRLQDSFRLDPEDGCHELTVESAGPIFAVAVQSDVPLDLQESQVAILSRSPPDAANGSATLATYRCCLRNSPAAPSGIGT